MKAETLRQIENINESLKWIEENRSDHYDQRFLELVGQRRRLRKIAAALDEKPAIAAYGESQKGKSYLIGNLLQKQKAPFMVKDERGEDINFVGRVNPIGDRKEATGVVTRFTSFNAPGGENRYRADHPVIVKLFSVANLAAILCDSYYNDLLDKKFYADDEILSLADSIYGRYKSMPASPTAPLNEDDVLDIKAYLSRYVKDAQGLLRSGYFDKLALVVRRVPQADLPSVLSCLWHENKAITDLFRRLLLSLSRLNFAKEVYVDFDAVMHRGDNRNTIMSVDCLNGLDDPDWALNCTVYIPGAGGLSPETEFPKCDLCALCAETIFRVGEDYLSDRDSFHFDSANADRPGYMTTATSAKLPGSVKKDLLADTDLLDFPGARNRLKVMENFLTKVDSEAGASNLVQMLLRGKVAFLFNHYSESRIINILLFCHDSDQPAVNEMYAMINDWVEKYVGTDPAARKATVDRCGGVSPLFVVGTKFNMDMIEKEDPDGDSENGLNGRWSGRFMKVLYTQSFKAESMEWFNNWDLPGSTFKNTYLLRDFKYSGCDGSGNNLYEGYHKDDPNPSETALHLSPEFYERLRRTFVTNPDVRKFFADPEMAWDAAATLNNDGALLIIARLAVVARNMSVTRLEQFSAEISEVRRKVYDIMYAYYVPEDADEILRDNIRKAHGIFREIEFTCQNNPEYFGRLLRALQLSESESFKEVHRLMPTLNATVNNSTVIKDYELIRERCGNFEGCDTVDDKKKRLVGRFHFNDWDEALEFLRRKGIDHKKMFEGETIRRTNSAVMTDALLRLWRANISGVDFINRYAGDVDEAVIGNLVDIILSTADSIGLQGIIEEAISDHVDVLNTLAINEPLVADIIATTISDYVTDFGYRYLTPEQNATARNNARDYNLECFDWISRERKETYDSEEMTELFNEILTSARHFTPSYKANYNCWLEHMYIAHIAHDARPDCKPEANSRLNAVLQRLKA